MQNLTERQTEAQRGAIRMAIEIAGNQQKLASQMSAFTQTSAMNISNYLVRGMSPEKAVVMHWVTGVKLHALSPIAHSLKMVRSIREDK